MAPGSNPKCFDSESLLLGKSLAYERKFYQAFVRFILAVLCDPREIIHSRESVINALKESVPERLLRTVTWSAISFATDRYFNEKAAMYGWTNDIRDLMMHRWYHAMVAAFVPTGAMTTLSLGEIHVFRADFQALHHKMNGPFALCSPCRTPCLYRYEVSIFCPPSGVNDFAVRAMESQRQGSNLSLMDMAAANALLEKEQTIGHNSQTYEEVDWSYCFFVHDVNNLPLSPRFDEPLLTFSEAVHDRLETREEKVFDSVLAGLPALIGDSDKYFISQSHSRWNPNGPIESPNCSPSCLAMVLKHFGKAPFSDPQSDPQHLIETARLLMKESLDSESGVTEEEFMRAALVFDLKTEFIHGLDEIDLALGEGKLIAARGQPDRCGAHWRRLAGIPRTLFAPSLGHIMLIVGRGGDRYIVNDPAIAAGPQNITRKELWSYLFQLKPSISLWA